MTVTFEYDWLRTGESYSMEPSQVPELLLSPCLHHLPVVASAISPSESVLTRDVSISVFERQDGRFEHLKSIIPFCLFLLLTLLNSDMANTDTIQKLELKLELN